MESFIKNDNFRLSTDFGQSETLVKVFDY